MAKTVEKFKEHIQDEVKSLYASFPQQPSTELSDMRKREHEATEKCHICYKEFSSENRKARDHCHYMGLYRGAAYNNCNLKYQIPVFMPIVFHKIVIMMLIC